MEKGSKKYEKEEAKVKDMSRELQSVRIFHKYFHKKKILNNFFIYKN